MNTRIVKSQNKTKQGKALRKAEQSTLGFSNQITISFYWEVFRKKKLGLGPNLSVHIPTGSTEEPSQH